MKAISAIAWLIALNSVVITSCSQENEHQTLAATTEQGTLALVANGEDFVRQGFVSKDGWQINFDHLYVNFSAATAYSTKSSFEPQTGDTKDSIKYQDKMELLAASKTIDLASGEANSSPILVTEVNLPLGFYNALSWKLTPAETDSPITGYTMALQGKATKAEQTINFDLSLNYPAEYICGEFVGEERQGIVSADNSGKLEATFHFDHVFGDGNSPGEEDLNQNALGFQPLADLAIEGKVKSNQAALSSKLSPQNYQKLTEAIAGLGHVGEGHCVVNTPQ